MRIPPSSSSSSSAAVCCWQRISQGTRRASSSVTSTLFLRSSYYTSNTRGIATSTTKARFHHAFHRTNTANNSSPSGTVFFAVTAAVFGWRLISSSNERGTVAMMEEDEESSSSYTSMRQNKKIPDTLFVWDFDWTVVNCNSDEYIPGQFITDDEELRRGFQEEFESPKNNKDWHACVEAMIRRAIDDHGATPSSLLQAARQMPYLKNVKDTLDDIHHHHHHHHHRNHTGQMILSDGNTLFIGAFLQEHGMVEHFTHGVISNEGFWSNDTNTNTNGGGETPPRLCVTHHSKPLGGHSCRRCPSNLCKTQALEKALKEILLDFDGNAAAASKSLEGKKKLRPRIVYVGDGANDACPVLNVLDEGDVMLARAGRKRSFANRRTGGETDEEAITAHDDGDGDGDEIIAQVGGIFGILPALDLARAEQIIPKCQVVEWRTGDDLKDLVRGLLEDVP